MGEVKDEIGKAIEILRLSEEDIVILNNIAGEKVFNECLNHFVKSGDRRWWWEDFRQPFFSFKDFDRPFEQLDDIMPDAEGKVWLIVEDDSEPFYPVYDAKSSIIGQIIAECFAFEYYIIDKNKDWLLCENHHNRLIGIGDKLRERNLIRLNIF